MSAPVLALPRVRAIRLPRRGSIFWLAATPVAMLACATLVMWLLAVPGGDDPAHLYKITLLREGQSIMWDNYWYAGSYGAITYGIVYYWIAEWVPGPLIVAAAGGLLPLLFFLYLRDAWGVASRAAAWSLAGVLVLYLAWGQSPFLLALCLTMLGLVVLARGRPALAALPMTVAVFANPLALVVGGVFLLADLIAHRASRRPGALLLLAMVPAIALRVALAAVFAAPSWELRAPLEAVVLIGFVAVGLVLTRLTADPTRRPLQWVFVTYAVLFLPVYLLPGMPLGSNVARFYLVFGVSILVAVGWPSRLPRWLPAILVLLVLGFQLIGPLRLLARMEQLPATRAEFFAPALRVAERLYDPDYRFHVVTPERHWESYFFPAAGFPITRGWYRQADALHNGPLYDEDLTAGEYRDWLRQMGVNYVFLPHAPLVANASREAAIVTHAPGFSVAYRDAYWTVYRLDRSEPLVVALSRRNSADVLALDHTRIRFAVSSTGVYRVKLTWSPYWLLARRPSATSSRGRDGRRDPTWDAGAALPPRGVLRRDAHGFILFHAPARGMYALLFDAAAAARAEVLE